MASGKKQGKKKYTFMVFKKELPLHIMLLPGLLLILVFSYTPMAGLVIAFQRFIPSKGMLATRSGSVLLISGRFLHCRVSARR